MSFVHQRWRNRSRRYQAGGEAHYRDDDDVHAQAVHIRKSRFQKFSIISDHSIPVWYSVMPGPLILSWSQIL